jgi:hypothetical protein
VLTKDQGNSSQTCRPVCFCPACLTLIFTIMPKTTRSQGSCPTNMNLGWGVESKGTVPMRPICFGGALAPPNSGPLRHRNPHPQAITTHKRSKYLFGTGPCYHWLHLHLTHVILTVQDFFQIPLPWKQRPCTSGQLW